MKIYTIKEYAAMQSVSVRAIQHRIEKGKLPKNHFVKRGGRENMIVEATLHEYKSGEYFDACCEFHRRKGKYERQIELAAELAVTYDIMLTKLCKLLGL